MKYFALIGMTILLMSGCEFIQGEPPEPTATPIPLVKIDSDDEFNELTRTDTDSNIVKWELDFKDKYIDLSNLGAFEITRITPEKILLRNKKVETWVIKFEIMYLPMPTGFMSGLRPVPALTAKESLKASRLKNWGIVASPTPVPSPTPTPEWETETHELSSHYNYYVSCGFPESAKPTIASFKNGDAFLIRGIIHSPPSRTMEIKKYSAKNGNMPSNRAAVFGAEYKVPLDMKNITEFDEAIFELSDCKFTPAPK